MFGKKPPPEPRRDPHPDGRVEEALQLVLSRRATIARKHKAADVAMIEAAEAMKQSRRVSSNGPEYCTVYAKRGKDLRDAARLLENEIEALHAANTRDLEALGDNALYLEALPSYREPGR